MMIANEIRCVCLFFFFFLIVYENQFCTFVDTKTIYNQIDIDLYIYWY